jgi:hypothetical protein
MKIGILSVKIISVGILEFDEKSLHRNKDFNPFLVEMWLG